MTHILFARIAWHPRYDGKYPPPYTGADWKGKKEGRFGEWLNFSELKGIYYGYVKPSKWWSADLRNIGAPSGAESVSGITITWVAPDPNRGTKIVGWYRNATMYSALQKRPKPLNESYLFKAKVSDCVLIDESHRTFEIQKQFRYLWYAKKEKELRAKVLDYIEKYPELINDVFEEPSETDFSDLEGKKVLRQHLKIERSSRLVKEFKKSLSNYQCSICGFDFEEIYSDIGKGFVEAHHIKPVFCLKPDEKVTINELVAVCSNCHRMLHRKVPPYTIEKIKSIIQN